MGNYLTTPTPLKRKKLHEDEDEQESEASSRSRRRSEAPPNPILASYPAGTEIYSIRNEDRMRVDNLLKGMFASRENYDSLSTRRNKEDFDKRREILMKNSTNNHISHHPIHCKTVEGIMCSNILIASLLPNIRRDSINYTLFTSTNIQSMNFTNKRKSRDMPHNPHVDINMRYCRKTIEAWITKSGIRNPVDGSSNVRVIRSGFLFQFTEFFIDKQQGGHSIFLCATKTRDNKVEFHIVDNLEPDKYYEHVRGGKSILDLCRQYIMDVDPSNFSVHIVHNQLPGSVPPEYTCISNARRAAMYAAIVEDFGHVDSWYEVADSALYNHNMKLYMHHMNRMINWFLEEENFWKEEEPWGLLHPYPFYMANPGEFVGDILVAQLTPWIAYVMVVKPKNVCEPYFFRGEGDAAFVPSEKERKGICTVSRQFYYSPRQYFDT